MVPGLVLAIDDGECLPIVVTDDEARRGRCFGQSRNKVSHFQLLVPTLIGEPSILTFIPMDIYSVMVLLAIALLIYLRGYLSEEQSGSARGDVREDNYR